MVEVITKYRAQGVDFDTRAEAELADAHDYLRQAGWRPSVADPGVWVGPRGNLTLAEMTGVLFNAAKAGGLCATYHLAETLAAAALGVGAGLTPIPQNLRDLLEHADLGGRWAPEDVVAVFEAGAGPQRVALATAAAEAINFVKELHAAEGERA